MATEWELVGLVHARGIGALHAACGASVETWPMFLDRAFDPRLPATCERCVQTLLRPRAAA